MKYEIQSRDLKSYKHTFNYAACKRLYLHYKNMNTEEFEKHLQDPKQVGSIGHLACFILWAKNKDQHEYRDTLGDYGLIHLLFHCLETPDEIERRAVYIHKLFKEDIKLS